MVQKTKPHQATKVNIGVFLNIGESIKDLKRTGQHRRLIDYYLKTYTGHFDKVYLFSYENESFELPKNCILVPNKYRLHRYLYAFFLPFIYKDIIADCQILRVMQLTGVVPALISKWLYHKKVVATHGFDYLKFARIEKKILLLPFLLLIKLIGLKFTDAIIATTEQLRKEALKYNRHVYYLPNGVDVNRFKSQKSKARPTARRVKSQKLSKIVLFVGRLEKQKNLAVLIKAVSKTKNIKLLFVGKGSQRKELISLSQKLSVPLEIIGTVSHHQLVPIYQKADIFVLPSLIEGHPKVLLEAMSCGLACIGNNVNGIKNLITNKQSGLLFNSTANDLTAKINLVANDKQLAIKLSQTARKFVEKDYNLNKLLKKETDIISNLAASEPL